MAKEIGIDLGTANVLINQKDKGIVLNEPSVVAVETRTNRVVAVGSEAYRMVGRTPGDIRVIRPLKDGVIADFDITEQMLTHFINKLNLKGFMSRPTILICCPTNITSIEQKAIIDAAEKAGGKKVYLELEPKVAAVGAGLDIYEPSGNMVVDIGGGTSDIAVLSMGEVVTSRSLRLAGDVMDTEIANFVRQKHNLLIGERTAEKIKIDIGYVYKPDPEVSVEVRGRDMVSGLPREITISSVEVSEALHDSMLSIIAGAKEVLEKTPPELSADIVDRGVMLTGGGALLRGISQMFSDTLQIPVVVGDEPLLAVALGTGILLDHLDKGMKI